MSVYESFHFTFPALKDKKGYWTLDRERQIDCDRYVKWCSFDSLSDKEKDFVIWHYHKMRSQVGDIRALLDAYDQQVWATRFKEAENGEKEKEEGQVHPDASTEGSD